MASIDTIQKLAEHPEWIAPRSAQRVFLGEPGAPEATKTTVEPGNVFSPGMKTFGVTWWLRFPQTDVFFATEEASIDSLKWHYEQGYLPVIHCDTHFEGLDVRHTLFQDGTHHNQSEAVCACLALKSISVEPKTVQVFIALRSLGPAGGPIQDLRVGDDARSIWLVKRNLPLLGFDLPPNAIGCDVGDPSPLARKGIVPLETQSHDGQGWCFGLARFDITLNEGQTWQLCFDCPQQTYGNLQNDITSTVNPRPEKFASRVESHLKIWQNRLNSLDLHVSDDTFRNAFFAGLQHMLTAVVFDQARIAPLSYPLPWLRDSVFIIRCFDLAGLHELARAATEYCARNDFFGGFGAEGDAPGEGIWALIEHYRVTKDKDWLRKIYPAVQRKVEWLFRMRRTTVPIQIPTDTPILAFAQAERAAGVICLAAQEGIIMGAMDHGIQYSLGWVNQWALAGLREAVYAADQLGFTEDAQQYDAEAKTLQIALESYATSHDHFFRDERTVNSLLWPTQAWTNSPLLDSVKTSFTTWWSANRFKEGYFEPEPYWLYFEFAQAHNALLMGERDIVWQVLNYRFRHQDVPGLYGWREGGNGVGTENAVHGVTLINQLRGCHKFEDITPHGWSHAEMWLLQRAILVEEWGNGLLLFAGVPEAWLTPNETIAFNGFPTAFGTVSAALQVATDSHSATITIGGADDGILLTVRLGKVEVQAIAGGTPVVLHIDL